MCFIKKVLKSLILFLVSILLLLGAFYLVRLTHRYFNKYELKACDDIVLRTGSLCSLLNGMNFYYGNLHSHTFYSDGFGTPDLMFFWAKHIVGYDFYGITDHTEDISENEWEDTGKQANRVTEKGEFVALRGFEWSPGDEHMNVYNTDTYVASGVVSGLQDFYQWIKTHNGLAQFNHPIKNAFNGFSYSAIVGNNVFAIETGNKRHGNTSRTFLPLYQIALDHGWRVAPTNNQDNHFLPLYSHRTVVIAKSLTYADLFEAIKNRRVYSSDDPNMKVLFKLGEHWMGSVVAITEPSISLTIYIEDDEPVKKVEILSNNGKVVLKKEFNTHQVAWEPILAIHKETFFYLKITEQDILYDEILHKEQITVTAPIWITRKN